MVPMNSAHKPPFSELRDSDIHEGIENNNRAIERVKKTIGEGKSLAADARTLTSLEQENDAFRVELERRRRLRDH